MCESEARRGPKRSTVPNSEDSYFPAGGHGVELATTWRNKRSIELARLWGPFTGYVGFGIPVDRLRGRAGCVGERISDQHLDRLRGRVGCVGERTSDQYPGRLRGRAGFRGEGFGWNAGRTK